MSDHLIFKLIEYRNGCYQGITQHQHPQGLGLLFDDDSVLYASIWNKGYPNGRTAVFFSREQYMFGDWRQGKPNGFNVYRNEDVIVLGNYENGKILGKRMVIFEKNNCAVVMSGEEKGSKVLGKKYFSTDEEQKKLIGKEFSSLKDVEQYIELIYFLKVSFCQNDGLVKLRLEEKDLRFGFEEGLGVIFNDNKIVEKMGAMNKKRRLEGLGVEFKDENEEAGDFERGEIVKYQKQKKPHKEIKEIFVNHHKKSIIFRNDYIVLKSSELSNYLNNILDNEIKRVPEKQIVEIKKKGGNSIRQTLTEQEVLKSIKQEMNKSVGKNTYMSKSPSKPGFQQTKFYYAPIKNYVEPQKIQFIEPRTNSPEVNRRVFLEKNHLGEYRDNHQHYHHPYLGTSKSKTYYNYGMVSSHDPKVVHNTVKVSKGSKPALSRPYVSPETKDKSRVIELRKVTEAGGLSRAAINPTYPQPSPPKRIDVSSIKYKNANSMQVSKKSQYRHSRQLQHQLQQERQRQRELKRFNNNKLSESIQKQIDQLPRLHPQHSALPSHPQGYVKQSTQLRFDLKRGSPEKQTSIKGIYSKYNDPNNNYKESIRGESPVDRIKDEIDSVDKMRQSKLYESRYRRYMEDQDIAASNNKKDMYLHSSPPKKKLSPVSVYQMVISESKQRLPKKHTETEREERSYDGDNKLKMEIKSRRIENEEDVAPVKYYEESGRKPKESRARKVIEIQHQRISPQGKKTTSYEKITKKYHYVDDLEE